MPADDFAWFAQTTGFALVGADAQGTLHTNEAADALIGGSQTFEEALARATGIDREDPGLEALLAAAHDDGRSARDLGRFRVLLVRDGEARSALLIPQALEVASAVHRRAAATDLSAAVSHELSNVLGAILGWATLARRTAEVEPKVDRALTLIEKSARSAHATARHLLDTARGRVVVPGGVVDASALVEEVAEVLTPKAEQRGVQLSVARTDDLVLRGNRADLFTVSWNLIQNAIEATPDGGVVEVRLEARDSQVALTVADQGDGIPAGIRTRVFEPYFTTKEDGTGLGLSLVRRAVDALGGTVALLDVERGACFVCLFPRADSLVDDVDDAHTSGVRGSAPRRQSGVQESPGPRGKRILVIDDDEAMRDLLSTTLSLAGAKVETAGSGAEARETEGYFDLVLVDLGLGDMRGDQLLAELRAEGRVGAAALVSGATLPPTLAASPDTWLRKPFELDELLSAVETLLSGSVDPKGARSG